MGNCVSPQPDNTLVITNRRINKLIKEDEKKLKTQVKLLLLGKLLLIFKAKKFFTYILLGPEHLSNNS